MSPEKEYSVVQKDEEAEEEAGLVRDVNRPSTRRCACWKLALLVALVFVAGVLVGYSIPMLVQNQRTSPQDDDDDNVASDSNTSNSEMSVSYGFLQTTRGQALLETLREELLQDGPKAVLKHINRLLGEDSQVASSCHPLTHVLGRISLREYGFMGAFGGLLGTDDAFLLRICNAAYLHGIIEHHLAYSTDLKTDVNMISNQICDKLTNVNMGRWECRHGVGHGVVQHIRRHKDEETLWEAKRACQNFTSFSKDCMNGVWMDHFASTRVSGELEPSSLQVCETIASQAAWACLIYSPTEYLLHYPRDYVGAIQFCHKGFNSTNNARQCVTGVGMQAAKENLDNYEIVEQACVTAPNAREQTACFEEALSYYTMTTGGAKVPARLCENLVIYKDLCLRKAGK